MLKEGCMASYSDQPEMATEFRFTRMMAEQAARARLTLDDDQLSLDRSPGCFGPAAVVRGWYAAGAVRLGADRAGEKFILDHFFASLPLRRPAAGPFSSLLPRATSAAECPSAPDLQAVMRQMTSGCRLLCFDEFHLHDPGDAMLIKVLLAHLFQRGIVLLATSNYPPEMLLPNPLYHDRFLPSIALIRAHWRSSR